MKKKILVLALISVLSGQTFAAARWGSFYFGTEGDIFSGIKDTIKAKESVNVFEKTKYNPDVLYNISAEEMKSNLAMFSDEKRKKAYLDFLLKEYNFNFENRENIKFVVNGNSNVINFNLYFKEDKYFDNIEDDLGFKKTICSSDVNNLLLANGINFKANYYVNDMLVEQKIISAEMKDYCSRDFAKRINDQSLAKVELSKEEKKGENKEKKVVIPSTLIHSDFKYENGKVIEEKESDFMIVKIEEPKVEVKRIPQIVTLSESDQQKILDLNQKNLKTKQKNEKINDVVNNINKIYKDLVEEDKPLFKEHVASLMNKYYEDVLKKKPKNNNSTTTVSNTNENVIFNVKFSRNYSSIAKDNVGKWKTTNEAKKFVCSDKLLSSMLEIGVKYEVLYSDYKGTVFYSEKVDDVNDCKK